MNAVNNRQLNQYKKDKISLLCDFGIELNKEDKNRLMLLRTEISIDNFIHKIIIDSLDEYEEKTKCKKKSRERIGIECLNAHIVV